jgi:hypothetical protein
MKSGWQGMRLTGVMSAMLALAPISQAQELVVPGHVLLVNMISPDQGNETRRDSEPNLAVNPANPLQMAASAFTPNPQGESNAPVYMSADGGRNWILKTVLPFNDPDTGTGDITLRFGSTSGLLYVSALTKPGYKLKVLRSRPFSRTDPSHIVDDPMEVLVEGSVVDQPYVQAISAIAGTRVRNGRVTGGTSNDRVYVAYNSQAGTNTATIDWSHTAATASFPSGGFALKRIDVRPFPAGTNCSDGPVRVAVHGDGTVYGAFFRYTANCGTNAVTANLVVVRDDSWGARTNGGAASNAFSDLTDPSDGIAGRIVNSSVFSIPFTTPPGDLNATPRLGKQRIGSQLSIAIDPSNSGRIYIAWAEGTTANDYTLRVFGSVDRGITWNERRSVARATNASLAINSSGKVGFLYQKLVSTPCIASEGCWETHLERWTDDAMASPYSDLLLHSGPDNNVVGDDKAGPLGDYNHLLSVGTDFYGVFSGNNAPDTANFPQGVVYQRQASFSSDPAVRGKLLAEDGASIDPSVDPFFFVVSEPIALDRCATNPSQCNFMPKMARGLLKLKCLLRGCTIVDLLPKNCLVKFSCPGCPPGGMCPPYFHIYLDGMKGAWRVGLLDATGQPVEHKQFLTRKGLVVSFRPDQDKYVAGQIGNYQLAFEMNPIGKTGSEYKVKTRLVRSDRHFAPGDENAKKAKKHPVRHGA